MKAWRSFDTFRPGTNIRTWLSTILRHAYFDRYRRGKREPETTDIEAIDEFYLYGHVHAAEEFRREAGDPQAAFFSALTRARSLRRSRPSGRSTGRCSSWPTSRGSPTARSARSWAVRWAP